MTLQTDSFFFFLIPVHLLSFLLFFFFLFFFFFFVKSAKELKTERKETRMLLNSILFFGVYDYFVVMKCFPESVEITVFSGQSVWEISGIILANCESSVSSIRGLRVCNMCLWSVSMFCRRCYGQETSRAAQPKVLAGTCDPSGSREKRKHPFSRDVSRDLTSSYLRGVPGSPYFQAYVDCASCPRPLGRLLFLYLSYFAFILFLFFIFMQ